MRKQQHQATTMALVESNSAAPKTALLWAYQLRQEHTHLVKRIDDVGACLSSTTERAAASEKCVADLQAQVRTLEAENHALHARIAALSTEFTTAVENISSQLTASTATNACENASSSSSAMQELQTQHETMARSLQESAEAATALQARVRALEEKCEQLAQRFSQVVDTSSIIAPESSAAPITPNNLSGNQMQTTTNVTPTTTARPPIQSQDSPLQTLKQDKLSLAAYYEHAAQLRSRMPRRKQEGHIVEAFVDGVSDATIKKSMEWYLDETAWIWSNLEQFCVQFFEAGNTIPNKRSTRSRRSSQRKS